MGKIKMVRAFSNPNLNNLIRQQLGIIIEPRKI